MLIIKVLVYESMQEQSEPVDEEPTAFHAFIDSKVVKERLGKIAK